MRFDEEMEHEKEKHDTKNQGCESLAKIVLVQIVPANGAAG